MNETEHRAVKDLCDDFSRRLFDQGMSLAHCVDVERVAANMGVCFDSRNAKFIEYLQSFRCETFDAEHYIQWNQQIGVEDKVDGKICFYCGATGTRAYLIMTDNVIVGLHEVDADDGEVTSFQCISEWLNIHIAMLVRSYEMEFGRKGKKYAWWKFWKNRR